MKSPPWRPPFNQMVSRQEEYTRRLEEQAMELERAHGQTVTACQIVREISALRTLEEMGAILLGRLRETLRCAHLALIILNAPRGFAVCALRPGSQKIY